MVTCISNLCLEYCWIEKYDEWGDEFVCNSCVSFVESNGWSSYFWIFKGLVDYW